MGCAIYLEKLLDIPLNKTENFIARSKSKFGDKFTYEATEYVKAHNLVKITCKIHGVFEITPTNHLHSKKGGCIQCQRENATVGTEDFIKRATERHNGKYDYSLVDYIKSSIRVKIICPVHGIFEQTPNSHLKTGGCYECSGKRRKTTEEFIAQAIEVHGYKYDYSLVEYKTASTKVKIICPEHGVFEQTPQGHVSRGDGCPSCGKLSRPIRYTQEEFIEKAVAVHGNTYDLSTVEYLGCAHKIYPTCKEHGIFSQVSYRFLGGYGCPKCANRGFKYDEPCELYIHKVFKDEEFIGLKFGVSYNHLARLKVLKQFSPDLEFDTVFVEQFNTGREAFKLESAIKTKFSDLIPAINKSVMEDGYTETLPTNMLDDTLEFITKYKQLPIKSQE